MTKQKTSVEIYRDRALKLMKMVLYKEITGKQWDMLERKAFKESQKLHKKETIDFTYPWSHERADRIDIEKDYNETFNNHEQQ